MASGNGSRWCPARRTTASRYLRSSSTPSSAIVASARELARRDAQVDRLPAAQDAHRDRPADQLRRHQPLQVADALDRLAGELDDHVAPPEPGPGRGAPADHPDALDP